MPQPDLDWAAFSAVGWMEGWSAMGIALLGDGRRVGTAVG